MAPDLRLPVISLALVKAELCWIVFGCQLRCLYSARPFLYSRQHALSAGETAGPLGLLLLLITRNINACATSLCTQSPSLLNPLLDSISSNTEPTAAAGTLGLLIYHVIFQQGLLRTAITSLAVQQGDAQSSKIQQPLCGQQIVLLQLLAAELEEQAGSR